MWEVLDGTGFGTQARAAGRAGFHAVWRRPFVVWGCLFGGLEGGMEAWRHGGMEGTESPYPAGFHPLGINHAAL